MLQKDRFYIPECEPRTFTPDLDGLIAWLETQDGATEYNWDSSDCLLMRFSEVIGRPNGTSYGKFLKMTVTERAEVSLRKPWTYAAALSRAKALRDAS